MFPCACKPLENELRFQLCWCQVPAFPWELSWDPALSGDTQALNPNIQDAGQRDVVLVQKDGETYVADIAGVQMAAASQCVYLFNNNVAVDQLQLSRGFE